MAKQTTQETPAVANDGGVDNATAGSGSGEATGGTTAANGGTAQLQGGAAPNPKVYVREKLKLPKLKSTIPTVVRDFLKAYDAELASNSVTDPWNCPAAEWSKVCRPADPKLLTIAPPQPRGKVADG